ncbi:MAG: (2Fe-2S)-binding protein [Candidatus Rokuibacteriota bacterium]|nr:MAG: (2Fe-2S)-binding protein [Candidatus Rokubacteria bacterium]
MCACDGPVSPASRSRRGFLFKLGLALNVVGAALVGIPVIGFILAPIRRHGGQSWIQVGPITNFPEGETRLAVYRNPVSVDWDGPTASIACWVRRVQRDRFQVFAVNCTHLGCPVRWFAQSRLFMCPCHGGAYYEDGSRASGPPPRGLFEYEYEIREGKLWVRGGQLPTLAGPV